MVEKKQSRLLSLSSNQLKIIAVILMAIDHFAYYALPLTNSKLGYGLNIITRISAPIFCFLVAEGYIHTRSKARYALRLLLFSGISHFPFVMYFYRSPAPDVLITSIFWTLFLGLIAIWSWDSLEGKGKVWQVAAVAVCALLSIVGDWPIMGVLMVWIFHRFRNNHKMRSISLLISIILFFIYMSGFNSEYMVFYIPLFGTMLSLPLISCYNGTRGVKSKILGYGFYIFYPLHLILFYLYFYFTFTTK